MRKKPRCMILDPSFFQFIFIFCTFLLTIAYFFFCRSIRIFIQLLFTIDNCQLSNNETLLLFTIWVKWRNETYNFWTMTAKKKNQKPDDILPLFWFVFSFHISKYYCWWQVATKQNEKKRHVYIWIIISFHFFFVVVVKCNYFNFKFGWFWWWSWWLNWNGN